MNNFEIYLEESETLMKAMAEVMKKREKNAIFHGDTEVAATLAAEMRALIDEFIASQDRITSIQEDKSMLLYILKKLVG